MSGPHPRLVVAVGVAAVTIAFGVSAVGACVPLRSLVTVEPRSSGPTGSTVNVVGLGFDESTVEVRWNAVDGPELAEATGPRFSVPVTIPSSPEGLYGIVVLSRAADGVVQSSATTGFYVSAPGAEGATVTRPVPGRGQPAQDKDDVVSTPAASRSLPWAGGLVLLGGLFGFVLTRAATRRGPERVPSDPDR